MNKVNTHSLYQRKNHWYENQLDSTYIKYTAKKQEYDVYINRKMYLLSVIPITRLATTLGTCSREMM